MANHLVIAAMKLAKRAHEGQTRKYTGEPYFQHCLEVQSILSVVSPTSVMSAAALLHDTLEDTGLTRDEIAMDCGIHVARIVQDLTDEAAGNRAERVAKNIERLARVSPEAQTIKCCDLISNTISIVERDRDFAKIYLPEKRRTLNVLTRAHPFLRMQAQTTLLAAEAHLAAINMVEAD